MLLPEPGAIYVMDRGYVDFARLHALHQAGAFFVTRAKSNLDAHRVCSAPADREAGVICDQTIVLDGYLTSQHYSEHLRRIRFKDPETGKTLVFLTNQATLPALTICALYKSRWQVELFFKWIKQHLRIKQFYGTSENAVKTQIWIACRSTCWSPSSESGSGWRRRSTHFCRSFLSQYSKRCRYGMIRKLSVALSR